MTQCNHNTENHTPRQVEMHRNFNPGAFYKMCSSSSQLDRPRKPLAVIFIRVSLPSRVFSTFMKLGKGLLEISWKVLLSHMSELLFTLLESQGPPPPSRRECFNYEGNGIQQGSL